ncbi:MAG: AAA domain-containing protein [Bacillota bacterium]
MEVNELITAFRAALAEEIAFLRQEGGRPLTAVDGVLIHRSDAGFLYAFEVEIEAFLLDGTPVRVHCGPRESRGEVVAVRGTELTLALFENLGDYLERAEIFAEPWFLLAALQERLDETPARNSRLALAALAEVPAWERRYLPPSRAAAAQEEAVRLAAAQEITFLWGPPGTGKTETLARLARLFSAEGRRVLILSHANVAVDGAISRTAARIGEGADTGLVLRWGWARLPAVRQSTLLAFNLAAVRCPYLRDQLRELEARRNDLLADLRAGRRPDSRPGELGEVEEALREVRALLKEAAAQLVREARVLGCTLAMAAADPVVYQGHYDAVLLDEAGMAYLPQVFFAASLARRKFVVSGDFRQLAPVALAGTKAVERWLKRDIFDQTGITAAFEAGRMPAIAVLRCQRRMHPAVAGFVNDAVYGGLLFNAPETARRAALAAAAPCPGAALVLVDVSDLPALCYRHGTSRFNPFSAFLALLLARQLRQNGLTVGLLTPYAAQARLFNALVTGLLGVAGARSEAAGLVAATVHRFQGAEQDAVVLDLVDAFGQRGPGGILSRRAGNTGQRLVNVAVTRARGKLFLLAHRSFLESRLPGDATVRQLFRFIEQNGRVVKGRELLAGLPAGLRGAALELRWYSERRPALADWQEDLRRAAAVQLDWPAAAGPPERTVTGALQRALAGGARLLLRAARPPDFPPELQPYLVSHPAARIPFTAVDREIFWFGCPWPGDGRVDRLSVRVSGERACRTLMYFLEMDMRREFLSGRYAGLRAYVENRFPCPRCGRPLTVRAGAREGWFLGCTAYPDCTQPPQRLTLEILTGYLVAAGLTCPAGHLLKAVSSRRGPLAVCAHAPACRCVFQVRDLL